MKKYIISIVVFFSLTQVAHASLQIDEIMYDPKGANAGHQWIEIYNPDDSPVSIDNTWRFNDGSSHYMNSKAPFTIDPSSFFILTGDKDTFLADHPGFSGVVIDTSMSLHKDGDTVSLLSAGAVVVQATYVSGAGGSQDGDSLQNINGVWTEGIPTPGVANEATAPVVPIPVATTPPPPTPVASTQETNPVVEAPAPIIVPPPVYQNPTPVVAPVSSEPIPEQVPVVPASVVTVSNPIPVSVPKTAPSPKNKKKKATTSGKETGSEDSIDLSALGASAGDSKAPSSSSILAWAGLAGIIIVGLAGTFFMRKKKLPILPQEELDEDDMTIME